jgi:RHS repeat-associated protein
VKRVLIALAVALALPRLAAAQPAETVEFYGQDAIGSIRIVWDASGNMVARSDYAPFGRQLFPVPAMPKQGFGGQEADGETDEGYFHARMLSARLGRFTRPDPVGAGVFEPQRWNRYAYAGNGPATLVDPDGLNAEAITVTSVPACDTFDCDSFWIQMQLAWSGLGGGGFGAGRNTGGFYDGGGAYVAPTTTPTTDHGGETPPTNNPTPSPNPPAPTDPPHGPPAGTPNEVCRVQFLKRAYSGVGGNFVADSLVPDFSATSIATNFGAFVKGSALSLAAKAALVGTPTLLARKLAVSARNMSAYPGLAADAANAGEASLYWANTAASLGEGLVTIGTGATAFATTADVYSRFVCHSVQ